jgi:hypothetical protein
MSLLSEVMEKYTRHFSVNLPLNDLTEERIQKIREAAKTHRGKTALRIRVTDPQENLVVDLPSRKFKVNAKEMMTLFHDEDEFDVQVFPE